MEAKQLTGQGAPQKAMDPMKEREPVETPGAAQALPAGDPAPFKPSRRYRFNSMYGLQATASNASVDDEAAAEASDVGEADQVDYVLVVKDLEEEDLQAAAAKRTLTPARAAMSKPWKEASAFMAS